MLLTVIVPSYNPSVSHLEKTLAALKNQTIHPSLWELIIVDNNSSISIASIVDLDWQPLSKVLTEPRQGLTFARIRGFEEAKGSIIILVDDDNILNEDYLQQTMQIFHENPMLGAIGGKSIPLYKSPPPAWLDEFRNCLALRDLGDQELLQIWTKEYPDAAPIGAGMAIRKSALHSYIQKIKISNRIITDRNGSSLASGGDNDIVIEILKSGWSTGYFPSLVLQHIIPEERMKVKYLARLINNTNKSWVHLLESHEINLWDKIPGWTVPLRKIKAWFVYKAWFNRSNYIRWRGACGLYDGLAQ